LPQYVNSWDYFIMGCGIVHCAFILYYAIEESLEILKVGLSYFFGIWNIMDLTVLVVIIDIYG
jgi:Polycystin cation channel